MAVMEKPMTNSPITDGLTGSMSLLRQLVEADIKRDGETCSTMVRAGLLRDVLDLAMRSSAPPVMGMEEMVAKMRSAFMSGWLTRHSSEEQPEAAFQVYLEAHGLSTPLVTGRE
jgi:hypothetical protein